MIEQGTAGAARIVDRGYRHYEGVRLGANHGLWTLIRSGLARPLGLRRPGRTKILPILIAIYIYAPVVVLLGIQILGSGLAHREVPSYTGLFRRAIFGYILFAALAAPELLCTDRRERVLALYYAAPITRLHYFGARVASMLGLLLLFTLLPLTVLFTGSALLAGSTATYLHDNGADFGHIALGGVLFAVYYGVVALAVAAFTDRRAYAAGTFLGLLLVTSAAANILASPRMRFSGHENFGLADLLRMPNETVSWFFGDHVAYNLSGWAYLGATLAVIAVGLALLAWRYLRGGDQ